MMGRCVEAVTTYILVPSNTDFSTWRDEKRAILVFPALVRTYVRTKVNRTRNRTSYVVRHVYCFLFLVVFWVCCAQQDR